MPLARGMPAISQHGKCRCFKKWLPYAGNQGTGKYTFNTQATYTGAFYFKTKKITL